MKPERHPGQIVSRTALEQHAWNLDLDSSSNIVDTHIRNLRRKLGNNTVIETVRGLGYRLKG